MSSSSSQPLLELENQNINNAGKKGISFPVAVIFIVGTMCGSGILALPKAIVQSGWFGIFILILCGVISSYTGNLLGKCWIIIMQRFPHFNYSYITDPYPMIGYRAAGKWGQYASRICVFFTLFGGGAVYLLLIVGNIDNLLSKAGVTIHTCYLIPIIAACLLPFMWLGTPKDFWQAGVLAALTTTIGAIFIVAGLALMAPHQPSVTHSNPSFSSFFTAFGTILFAYGGASIFPTIQVDMKKTEQFPMTVVIGIIIVLAVYLSVSVAGFVVLGDSMKEDNILDNMDGNWILVVVIILITSHLLLGFIIVVNPVSQDIEGFFNIEDRFCIKRVIARSGLMVVLVFTVLSVPHFSVILSLVGATTIACSNFIFPPMFFILLSRQKSQRDGFLYPAEAEEQIKRDDENHASEQSTLTAFEINPEMVDQEKNWVNFNIPFHIKVVLVEIMLIGFVGGIASVYSAISSLVDGSSGFTTPCYLDWSAIDA